jgi:hypothetical protein
VRGKRKRNSDGTFRCSDSRKRVTDRSRRARWVEEEVASHRDDNASFSSIAKSVGAAGRGEVIARVPVPKGMAFEESYRISERAAREAYRRFQNRERSGKNTVRGTKKSVVKSLKIEQPETPEQKFKELMLRLDNLWLHLQLKIRKGNVRANAAGLRIMKFTAKLYRLGVGPP